MIERGRSFGFLHKPPHAILISREIRRQNLQSNFTIELCVLSQIYLTHSARADLRADFVTTKFCTSEEHR